MTSRSECDFVVILVHNNAICLPADESDVFTAFPLLFVYASREFSVV